MLQSLRIQNLAIIQDLTLEFGPGLTIVTGETGAGKSILIQAVGALLGDSLHTEAVRSGCSLASVDGVFSRTDDLAADPDVAALELDLPQGEPVILRREILRNGRSRFTINDQIVRKSDFQAIGTRLLDVNSQHSHQVLLKSRNHLRLYDAALPAGVTGAALREAWEAWHRIHREYRALTMKMDEVRRRRELLEYQVAEIDAAALKAGEKADLVEERERLRFAEEIQRHLDEACEILDEIPGSLTSQAASVAGLIDRAARRDSRFQRLGEQAEELSILARDIADEVNHARDTVEISPERLNAVSERIHLLQQLERKFQNDIDGIVAYRETIRKELDGFQSRRLELDALHERWGTARDRYIAANRSMSRSRREACREISREIAEALADLGMTQARFDVAFNEEWDGEGLEPGEIPEICEETGTDRIEFMFSANPGVPLKPLASIASGGELSRIMLALKQHFSDAKMSGTLVFDE
nr:AAA family ATPase [bacterium]